jgi:hypothetical protein
MSPRTYARRFREATGTTPLQWLCAEPGPQLRVHFSRVNQVSPHAYQRTFRARADDGGRDEKRIPVGQAAPTHRVPLPPQGGERNSKAHSNPQLERTLVPPHRQR